MKRRHPANEQLLSSWTVESLVQNPGMAALVETSSRACARDVVAAQAAGHLAQALRNGPAHLIAQLVDAGKGGWVGTFFDMFVGSLHRAETLIGLEPIGSEAVLSAISEHVVGLAQDLAAWHGILLSLEPQDFPGWPDTVN